MLVQLNRNTEAHTFTATATDVPINPRTLPEPPASQPVVAVFGPAGRVAGLAQHLPPGWSLRRPAGLDDVRADEMVLFAGASVSDITAARMVLPRRTRVVALVNEESPADTVAGVLTAGADVCVRAGQPAILASHLVACRRRQLADHWARLDLQHRH